MNTLNGKVFLILGATGGAGKPIARTLIAAGAHVILSSRTEKSLIEAQEEIDPEKNSTSIFPADAIKVGQVTDALKFGVAKHEKVDAIICSIGRHVPSSADDDPWAVHHVGLGLLDSMVTPTFNAIFESQQFFRKQGFGWILNMSSHVVFKDEGELPNNIDYRLAKVHGDTLLQSILPLLKAGGARGTNLRPGTLDTPGNEKYLNTSEKKAAAIDPGIIIGGWIVEHFTDTEPPASIYFESGHKF